MVIASEHIENMKFKTRSLKFICGHVYNDSLQKKVDWHK